MPALRSVLPAALRRPLLARLASTAARTSDASVPTNDPKPATNLSHPNAPVVTSTVEESSQAAEAMRAMQAPNRKGVWSRQQQPRQRAMVGPRFEQTVMEKQPRPPAAIDLIHKQPVRWTDERVVACDGGGGPLGHPRIFINTDKPQICWCTYCGVPYAHNHHRKLLESLPKTSYPLEPTNDPATVAEPQRVTNGAFEQR